MNWIENNCTARQQLSSALYWLQLLPFIITQDILSKVYTNKNQKWIHTPEPYHVWSPLLPFSCLWLSDKFVFLILQRYLWFWQALSTVWQVSLSIHPKIFVILTGPIYCLTSFSFYSPKDICDSDRPHLLSDKFLFLFTQRYLWFGQALSTVWQVSIHPKIFVIRTGPIYCLISFYSPKGICDSDRPCLLSDKFVFLFTQRYLWLWQAPSTVWQVSLSIHPKIFVILTGPIYCLTSFSFYSPKDIDDSDRPHLLSDKFLILFTQRYWWFWQAPSTVWQVSLSIHPKIFVILTGPIFCLISFSFYSPKDICDSDRPHLLSDKFLFLFTQRYLWQVPSTVWQVCLSICPKIFVTLTDPMVKHWP